jgi:hypothetical protein
MRRHARATAWALSLFAALAANTSHAADLIWEVESPFRFFKPTRAFALHEAAFNAVRGDPSQPLPADIIWRTERALNDPTAARRPPASAISKAASAGRLRRWARPAMKATAVPAAILRSASADIPGARREKITFCGCRFVLCRAVSLSEVLSGVLGANGSVWFAPCHPMLPSWVAKW